MEQHYNKLHGNPTLINGFEDVMAHIKKLEEENKKLKEQNKKIMEERMEAKRQFSQEREMMQDNLDKAYACIERDCKTLEIIEEIGVVVATKEEIDELTDNNLIRETLYELYDITLPEEDED